MDSEQAQIHRLQRRLTAWRLTALGALALAAISPALTQGRYQPAASYEARLAALEAKLAPVSRQGNDWVLTAVNLKVTNGVGWTDSRNGLGNLILGYNERPAGIATSREGSHCLVIGAQHNWGATAGIISGFGNTISTTGTAVIAATYSAAVDPDSAVIGGFQNLADGERAVVIGGQQNDAAGPDSGVFAGQHNGTVGWRSVVLGGDYWMAFEDDEVHLGH